MFKHVLDNRTSIYLLPFLGGMLIVIVSFFVVIPKAREIPATRQTINEQEIRLVSLGKKRKLLESVESGSTKKYLDDANLALPSDKDVPSIITTLENTALSSGVTLDSLDLSPGVVSTESGTKENQGESRKGANLVTVSAVIRGSTEQFRDFVTKLHIVKRIFDIQSIKLSYFPDQKDILQGNFSLTTYYLSPITQIGGVETELPPISQEEQSLFAKLATYPDFTQIVEATTGGTISNEPLGKSDLFSP